MSNDSADFQNLFRENERTVPKVDHRQFIDIGALLCEAGETIPNVTVAYETWGTLNPSKSNAVLVCHALTGDSHCIGWWERLVGPNRPIDTNKYFVIGQNVLGGCQGTTGPSSMNSQGKRYGSSFPMITVRDMVRVQIGLLDYLGINRLHAVAGGSMGGMQALEWSVYAPNRVKKVFTSASSAAHSPMQIGYNETARQAIIRDKNWKGGDYEDKGPVDGLAIARMIGHLSFLSESSFERKFSRRLQNKERFDYSFDVEFEVESYLKYQAEKFTDRFDANSLLYLTRAIDYYDLESFIGAEAEFLFVSYSSDWLYPAHQSEKLLQMALKAGCKAKHINIELPFGHDSFLLDGELQGAALSAFLED